MAKNKLTSDELFGNEKYPFVPVELISIVERPEEGQESNQLFFNPREPESFDEDSMEELYNSVVEDGLQNPIIVRAITDDEGYISDIQLIAGERRFRTYLRCLKEDVDAYNMVTGRKEAASKHLNVIPCVVHLDITDSKALKLAFTENSNSKPLTVKEEISLIHRLRKGNRTQKEVADLLGSNITLVCQLERFEEELPPQAFEDLLAERITKYVAVIVLAYPAEKREAVYNKGFKEAQKEFEETLKNLDKNLEDLEQGKEVADAVQELSPDDEMKKVAKKKSKNLDKQIEKTKQKKEKVAKKGVKIKSSHIERGAQVGGVDGQIRRKSDRIASKKLIQSNYVEMVERWIDEEKIDPLTKEPFPIEDLQIVVLTAQAILRGDADPSKALRDYYISIDKWEMLDAEEEVGGFEEVDEEEGIDLDEELNEDFSFESEESLYEEVSDIIEESDDFYDDED